MNCLTCSLSLSVHREMMEEFDDGLPQRKFDNVRRTALLCCYVRHGTHFIVGTFSFSLWTTTR
jgi:hypothetical protein